MPIGYDDIDPTISTALRDRYAQIFAPNAQLDPLSARIKSGGTRAWREIARKHTAYFWGGLASFVGIPLAAATLAPMNEGLAAIAVVSFFGAGIGLVARGFRRVNQEAVSTIAPDTLRAAGSIVTLSSTEQLYCDAVAALIEADQSVSEATRIEILAQLNGLMESSRKLDREVNHFRTGADGTSLAELEQEHAALVERRNSQQTERAREMMEQSITLCGERLAAARAMLPVREQAEAQKELIEQTLASVQASLARLRTGSGVMLDENISALQSKITVTYAHAKAVEDAVAELNATK